MRLSLQVVWVLSIVATAEVYIGYLAVQTRTVRAAYDLREARVERERLLEERRPLSIERQSLRNPRRIRAYAIDRLGLGPPAPVDDLRKTLAHPQHVCDKGAAR